MFCNNCGKEITKDSRFCINCGAKVDGETIISNPLSYTSGSDSISDTNNPKKKSRVWIPIAIGSAATAIIAAVVLVLMFNGVFKLRRDNPKNNNNQSIKNENINQDNDQKNKILSTEEIDSENKSNTNNSKDDEITQEIYDYKYSYIELPDVLSLDSDTRFLYENYYSEEDIAVYSYRYMVESSTDTQFYQACDDYSNLLQSINGFTFEEDYSNQQFEETGQIASYFTRDNYVISVNASIEDSLYYVHVSIYPLIENTPNNETNNLFDMPNYNTYLAGRELKYFSYEETVNMENGLSFYIYDVVANYPGDGTMSIDVTMDLSSYYTDYYMYNGDFMILPMDSEGNALSDSIPITNITDVIGGNVTLPFLVSASSYDYYTFTFIVPPETTAFIIYATNAIDDEFPGPVYGMDVP